MEVEVKERLGPNNHRSQRRGVWAEAVSRLFCSVPSLFLLSTLGVFASFRSYFSSCSLQSLTFASLYLCVFLFLFFPVLAFFGQSAYPPSFPTASFWPHVTTHLTLYPPVFISHRSLSFDMISLPLLQNKNSTKICINSKRA